MAAALALVGIYVVLSLSVGWRLKDIGQESDRKSAKRGAGGIDSYLGTLPIEGGNLCESGHFVCKTCVRATAGVFVERAQAIATLQDVAHLTLDQLGRQDSYWTGRIQCIRRESLLDREAYAATLAQTSAAYLWRRA